MAIGKVNTPSVDFNAGKVCDHLSAAKLNSQSATDLAPVTLHIPICTGEYDAAQCIQNVRPIACFWISIHPFSHFYSKILPLQAFTIHDLESRSTHIHRRLPSLGISLSMHHQTYSNALVPLFTCKPNCPLTPSPSSPSTLAIHLNTEHDTPAAYPCLNLPSMC